MKHFYPSLNVEVPGKDDVKKVTPTKASRDMMTRLEEQGVETVFDRFEAQQPQCSFGLQGTCCRMCLWGPCRLGPKTSRGICGRDSEAVVFANLLRGLAAGMACHARHAHEVILTLIAVSEGRMNLDLKGGERVIELAGRLGLPASDETVKETAGAVGRIMLDDLGKLTAGTPALLRAYAPQHLVRLWEELDIMPRSPAYEIMEALHMTSLGGCSDWRAMASQELRSALAYGYGTLFGSSLATEILYGLPEPKTAEVSYGVLKKDHVNILVHGHSPVMIEKVLEKIKSPEIQKRAGSAGAKGIVVGGMCCTGGELLARYGIPTVTNIMGQELALGTGAVDAVVVDMQCVIPGMQLVADCFGTRIITTCGSNRIPGAVHVPFDPERPESLEEDASRIARTAVDAFKTRDRSRARIPRGTARVMAGWSCEAIIQALSGADQAAGLLKKGDIKGIATIVGCNTPKVPYENSHVTIAKKLIESDVLLTSSGCSSHALMNAGLCSPDAGDSAGPGLKRLCREAGIPPVLVIGGCVDNARTLRLFAAIAEAAGVPMPDMPFLFVGPEPGNEKAIGQGVTFLCHGISNVVGFPAQVPAAVPFLKEGARFNDELDPNRNPVVEFFGGEGLQDKLGAKVYVEVYPKIAAQTARMHIHRKRRSLGWE